jgi:orotate phosphoribosyltransferase
VDRRELGKRLYEAAYLTGTFKLRSGQISSFYFDKYLFESDPKLLAPIVEHLTELIPAETEILAGLDLGGIPIATGLSLHTGKPAVFVRKKAKDYGTNKLAEGIAIDGRELLIVEDVVTTGGQIIESANEIRALGGPRRDRKAPSRRPRASSPFHPRRAGRAEEVKQLSHAEPVEEFLFRFPSRCPGLSVQWPACPIDTLPPASAACACSTSPVRPVSTAPSCSPISAPTSFASSHRAGIRSAAPVRITVTILARSEV